jgi:hypothetical protein
MAVIIPINNTKFATAGEGRFYRFLQDSAKPDTQCVAWYAPAVEGLEPDFVLYTPETGLVVFEVKDWVLSQILRADSRAFILALERNREEARPHPLYQGRGYVFALLNRIRTSCKRLLSSDPRYLGKSRLPVHCGAVFTNITREEYDRTELGKILPVEKVFFEDDLAATDGNDPSGRRLRNKLTGMFPPPFSFRLDMADMTALRELLWPKVRISLPQRAGEKSTEDANAVIRRLDARQESLARRLDASKAILHGPAGSGKTLVLIHKAVEEHARLRRNGLNLPVLIVCYNLTLVHYLKRLMAGHNACMGRKDIRVMHFYDFCRSLLQEPLAYENENAEYYDLVMGMALDAAKDGPRYGAVFVDEGQDFSDAMLSVLRAVLADGGLFIHEV